MDVARRQDAAEIRQWWTTAPRLDENALRDGVLLLVKRIHEAAADDDWDTVRDHIRLYELGEAFCNAEPQLSTYEFGRMDIDVMLAGNHISRGEYSKAAEKIEQIQTMYVARMQRYEEQGTTPRRASEVRYKFLLRLADLKWIGPEDWRDFLMSPDMVLDEMRATYAHIVGFLQSNPGFHTNQRSLMEGLALCELVGLKMALRYAPSRVPDLVRNFNEHHSDHLAIPLAHYKLADAAEADKSAYYWDFELAKLRMSANAPAQDIYMCIELRSLTARNTFGDWKIQGLLRGWRREALTIVRELQARKEKA
jgi:hypothetical protein